MFLARHEMNEEAVALLTTALSALVDAAKSFRPSSKLTSMLAFFTSSQLY
jgi:hypothetical protein